MPAAAGKHHRRTALGAGTKHFEARNGHRLVGIVIPLRLLHDVTGVLLDSAEKARQRDLAALDFGKLKLPLRGEQGRFQARARHVDKSLAALGGEQGLALADDVAALQQALYDGCAGGRRAEARRVHRVVVDGSFELCVVDGAPCVLHGGKQGRIGVGFGRRGLALLNVGFLDWVGRALADIGGYRGRRYRFVSV